MGQAATEPDHVETVHVGTTSGIDLTDPGVYPPSEQLTSRCDLVMKGGITSGVIYPRAVCQLATTRKITRVGGTSAGAIAAGAAAAAETGRASGGFARLAALPNWLSASRGKHTNLYHLFQAQPSTRALYRLVAVFVSRGAKTLPALVAGLRALKPFPAVASLLVPVVLLALAIFQGGWVGIVAAALLVVIGLMVAIVWSLVRRLVGVPKRNDLGDLARNDLGLCSGMHGPDGGGAPPLTEWLADVYDDLAGHTDPAAPVTFGDLHDAGVELAMFTTNLSLGTQAKLPFTTRIWAFSPDELRRLFPDRIVQWMIDHPPEPGDDADREVFAKFRAAGLEPLPDERGLPLVVGVRMSLSFPVLLSTVPLHAFDYTRSPAKLVTHRFSDGGITSNFPLQFFDHAIPEHPTFAINLVKVSSVSGDPDANVSMPRNNRSGILARAHEVTSFKEFVNALKNSLQNWADAMQTHVPGYRDRIVAVLHTGEEGGLNLDMDESVVQQLAVRGQAAGRRAEEFDMVNHRWVRFRSFLEVLEDLVVPAAASLASTEPPDDVPTYRAMIDGEPPSSYRTLWNAEAGHDLADAIQHLADAYQAARMDDGRSRFEEGAPSPTPELQIRPKP